MRYLVKDTEDGVNAEDPVCLQAYFDSLPTEKESVDDDGNTIMIPIDSSAYKVGTSHYDIARQRATDGKWVKLIHLNRDTTGLVIEELNTGGEWFPEII